MNTPLISVIVTTYNNHATLDACLKSITRQRYEQIELIVVDNHSTDDTLTIAKRYTPNVFTRGPERCAQRNYAVGKAKGEYVVIIDSDMELTRDVIGDCVGAVTSDSSVKGVIIPEESFGEGFWAKCKQLERSYYVGVDWIEAARFFDRAAYKKVGGYDESMTSGEDWDLSQRIGAIGNLGRVNQFILHNEGRLYLWRTLKKKFYYAQKFTAYTTQKAPDAATSRSPLAIVLKRFRLFFSRPGKLLRHPIVGVGMLFMKTAEFGYGAVGYLFQRKPDLQEGV